VTPAGHLRPCWWPHTALPPPPAKTLYGLNLGTYNESVSSSATGGLSVHDPCRSGEVSGQHFGPPGHSTLQDPVPAKRVNRQRSFWLGLPDRRKSLIINKTSSQIQNSKASRVSHSKPLLGSH